jgi:predicted nucleotidyltransferase
MVNHAAKIDLKKVKNFLEEKEKKTRQKRLDERSGLIAELKSLADLWEKFKIRKVYLYGSLANGQIHNESDIDIAVEGNLSYQDILTLYGLVDRRITCISRELDLRNLDELPFQETIGENGVLIYEK